jgi:hypothetical protein
MRAYLLSVLSLLISGCATRQSNPELVTKPAQGVVNQQFSGHWSVGLAYSWFTPLGTTKLYWIDSAELPKEARNLLDIQPSHATLDGPEVSLFMTLGGYLAPDAPLKSLQQLHVLKVNDFHTADKDFVAWRKSRQHITWNAQQSMDGKTPEAPQSPH